MEKRIVASKSYDLYENREETSTLNKPDETIYESKKKRRLKSRTSSKLELLQSEEVEDLALLSPRESRHSRQSLDSELERYNRNKNEMVLEDFRSPKVSRPDRTSRPTRLTEESTYASLQERNESVVSRPRSPSPKRLVQSYVKDSEYVLSHGKGSQSSLSTVHLQDHGEDGKLLSPRPSVASRPALSPTQEESIESKKSSRSSLGITSPGMVIGSLKEGDIQEEPVILEEGNILSPNLSLSRYPIYGIQETGNVMSPRESRQSSQLSLSNAIGQNMLSSSEIIKPVEDVEDVASTGSRKGSPRHSNASEFTNVTLDNNAAVSSPIAQEAQPIQSESLPVDLDPQQTITEESSAILLPVRNETQLTSSVPVEQKEKNDLVVASVVSEDEGLVFEDEFTTISDQNNDFLQNSLAVSNAALSQQQSHQSNAQPPDQQWKSLAEAGFLSDADSQKIAGYVDAFKRRKKKSSQYSYGSDSGESHSEVPIALLNEETDTYALTDSLNRVKKLSDAFPSAADQDRLKKRSLPHPHFRTTESMAELSVVEYNRKKKLQKKRPGSGDGSKPKGLPPLRGRRPLPEVTEEDD